MHRDNSWRSEIRTAGQQSNGQFNPFVPKLPDFEICEKRLVLSAQWLAEPIALALPLDSHAQATFDDAWLQRVDWNPPLELHAAVASTAPRLDAEVPQTQPALENHLREAHLATGWAAAREQFGLTGAGQTVAVIDSGIAWDHVSLGGGYGAGYRVVGGWDFTEENDSLPYDDGPAGFHGTHVAGIIASDHATHPGVAPDADLVALRVFNDRGQGQMAWVEQALAWVYENRNAFENPITTVNLSLGASWNSDQVPTWGTLENELQQLANAGIVVVASAGNSFEQYNTPGLSYPAASPYVLPVASVDDNGLLSDFSQRNSRVLAAPGENILSTVPDYLLGSDGRFDDFSTSSGTSMSAPYVAGAAVLVRQAMEMVGWESINLSTISDHLRATAQSVYDSVSGAYYDRLDLAQAIDALIPDDVVGDQGASSLWIEPGATIDGWINSLNDRDVYRFTSQVSGTLQLDASSDWVHSLQWQLMSTGQTVASGTLDPQSVNLVAGAIYELHVSSAGAIGPFHLDMLFTADNSNNSNANAPGEVEDLGTLTYHRQETTAATGYRAQAARDGIFTVQWTHDSPPQGELRVEVGANVYRDSSWVDGTLRVDVPVQAGEWLEFSVPASSGSPAQLDVANSLQIVGETLSLAGTPEADEFQLDLQNGVQVSIGSIQYHFDNDALSRIDIVGGGNNDRILIVGSSLADKVDMVPGRTTLENTALHVSITEVEVVNFDGGGGADRVYLYDSDTDDRLTAHPRRAILEGVGYRFEVSNIDRMFMHATGGGEDIAYLYDSAGNDTLSVRPQFTSLSGDGFFNYVRGFERVYAYANQGGWDTADIYDSAADDRFMTHGAAASIVGPGFASYTRGFEQVVAHATAGGRDVAAFYAHDSSAEWQVGSGQVGLRDATWLRESRHFEVIETYVAGAPVSVSSALASDLGHTSTHATDRLAENNLPGIGPSPLNRLASMAYGASNPPPLADFAAAAGVGVVSELEPTASSLDAWAGNLESPTLESPTLESPTLGNWPPQQHSVAPEPAAAWSDWLVVDVDLAEEDLANEDIMVDPAMELAILDRLFIDD